MATVIALAALKGGVGRTTLAANLASALVHGGRKAIAVDLDPQNGLGAHFGRGPAPDHGIGDLHAEILPGPARGADRRDGARGEAFCMPFGAPSPDELAALEAKLLADPSWLRRRVDAATPAGCEIVVLDTPGHNCVWLDRALEMADLVLGVVAADPACYATLPAFEALLIRTRRGQTPARYVVNQFDGASPVRRDVLVSLREIFAARVAPMVIHSDESLKDALGRQQTLFRDATAAQALADIGDLGDWVLAQAGVALTSAAQHAPPRRAAGHRS